MFDKALLIPGKCKQAKELSLKCTNLCACVFLVRSGQIRFSFITCCVSELVKRAFFFLLGETRPIYAGRCARIPVFSSELVRWYVDAPQKKILPMHFKPTDTIFTFYPNFSDTITEKISRPPAEFPYRSCPWKNGRDRSVGSLVCLCQLSHLTLRLECVYVLQFVC